LNESISRSRRELSLYACKIKETANGGWRSARREAMSKQELRRMAKTKRKRLPTKKRR
jgi:hypothetical protein